MTNDGGTRLVCKKCGFRTTTRQCALCLGFLLLLSSISDFLHLRTKKAFNNFLGAKFFLEISRLNYYEALDMLSKLRFDKTGNHSDLSNIIKMVFCFEELDCGNGEKDNQD